MDAQVIDFATRRPRAPASPAFRLPTPPGANRYIGRRVLHPIHGQGTVEVERLEHANLFIRFDRSPQTLTAAILPSLTFLDPPAPKGAA